MTTINTSNCPHHRLQTTLQLLRMVRLMLLELPSQKLAAIDSKFPNLDADLSKARAELEDVHALTKWGGLKWFEKAIFFLPPFGPLVGVAMMSANKDMIRNTEKKVTESNIVVLQAKSFCRSNPRRHL